MKLSSTITKRFLQRKLTTLVFVSASVVAFATLGDDSGKKLKKEASVLLPYSSKNFSLRSNYNYRSNKLFTAPEKREFIMLNPVVTYQRGNTAYVMPLKKMPMAGKITFAPSQKQY